MSKVWGDRFAVVPDEVLVAEVSANAKVLWAILARYADPGGHAYPSLKTLAEVMRCSKDTVGRAKKELIDAQLLSAEQRSDDQGRRTSDDLFLQGASRKSAGAPHRKFAVTGSSTQKEGITTTRPDRKNGQPDRLAHEEWDSRPFWHEIPSELRP
jgi:DNA-binding transcriptional MocR family regulator